MGFVRVGAPLRVPGSEVPRVVSRPASDREAGTYASRLSVVPLGRRALEVPPRFREAVPRVAAWIWERSSGRARRVAAARSAAVGRRLIASRSIRGAVARVTAGRSSVAVRVGVSRRTTGDVSRPEPAEGVRSVRISGRVRTGAAESVRVTAGGWTMGARGGATDGVAGRVMAGAVRTVPGVRVTVEGGGATGARGVATDGVAGRVKAGAVRTVPGVRVTVAGGGEAWRVGAAGAAAGRSQVTVGRGVVVRTGCGADWRVTAGAGALTRDGTD